MRRHYYSWRERRDHMWYWIAENLVCRPLGHKWREKFTGKRCDRCYTWRGL